jgi:hypothetical protein
LGQKLTLLLGHSLMCTSLFGVLICNIMEKSLGVLCFLVCLIVFF